MECMKGRALKSSFSSEIAMNPQAFPDDFWCVTGGGLPLPAEDFSIDQFFNEDVGNFNGGFEEEEEEEEGKDGSSLSLSSQDPVDDFNSGFNHFSTDLAIPVDDMQELELWSHLMDDSVSEPTIACPNPILSAYKAKTGFNFLNRVEPVHKQVSSRVPVITSAVPVKPRSKRARTGNPSWIFGSSSKTESSTSSSSSASSPVSTLFFPPPVHEMGMFFTFGKPTVVKRKKKPAVGGENPPVQRKCSHCQVTKTPQWRAGPNGPKTLCNACGVRFKSGRLFPEYRPACSPTFSSEIHSNSHRKVLEMRKKKEAEPVSGSTPTVLSS